MVVIVERVRQRVERTLLKLCTNNKSVAVKTLHVSDWSIVNERIRNR